MTQVLQGTDDEWLRPKRGRVMARLLLLSVGTLCSLGVVAALAVLFDHLAHVQQADALSAGQMSVLSYRTTSVPTSALPSLPSPVSGVQRLLINGRAQVSGGLVLTPGTLPSIALTGELYYDQATNQPYFYNGSAFVSLQQASAAVSVTGPTTTIVQQITNTNGAALSGLVKNGVVYATGAGSVATATPGADGVLVTDGADLPAIAQALPMAVQGNIVSTGTLMSGSIAQGFGGIITNSNIVTSTTLQGGTVVVGTDGVTARGTLTVRGGTATGTSVAGSDLMFDAANGTGSAGSGALIFRTATSNVAPVTLDNADEGEDYGGPVTLNGFTVGTESNMVMVVGVSSQQGAGSPVGSITWNGSSAGWVKVASEDDPAGNHEELWYLVAPATGSHNLTVALTGGYQHIQVGVGTFYNVNQANPVGTFAKNEGQAGASPITTSLDVPTASGQTVVDVASNDQFSFTGVASGQTRIYQDSQSSGQLFGGSYKAATGGTTTMGWQVAANGFWSDIAVPLNPLSGALPDTLTDRLHITGSGNIGVDNANPQYTLDVAGTGNFSTSVLSPLFDTASATALNIGTTNATQINLNQNVVIVANKSLSANGAATFTDATNSTTAFQVQNASNSAVLDVDTTNGYVGIGTSTPSAKLDISDIAFSDVFNRANSTSLGSNWTKVVDAGTDFQIVSNQLKETSSDNSTSALGAYTTQGITGPDYGVQSDIVFPSSSDDWLSVMGRASLNGGGNTNGYYLFASMGNQKIALYKQVGTTWTQLGASANETMTAGTTYTMKLVMNGTSLSGYWNGALAVSTTDSTYTSAGFAGVAVGFPNLANSIWDNFSITSVNPTLNVNDNFAVTANGWVGIGTTSPSYGLDLQDGNSANVTGGYLVNGANINTAGTLSNVAYLNQANTFTSSNLFKDGANSAAAFQIQNASGTALLVADTTGMQVIVTSLVISANLTLDGHIVTGGTTPGVTAGAAACTTPTVTVSGDDTAGQVTITTGTGCNAAGTLATVTFGTAYASAPRVQLTPDSAAAAGLLPYKLSTTTNFALNTSNTPADATTYTFDYLVAQ